MAAELWSTLYIEHMTSRHISELMVVRDASDLEYAGPGPALRNAVMVKSPFERLRLKSENELRYPAGNEH